MYSFFFILLFSSLLCANTAIVTENDPNTIVEGVSVITGDLYVLEEDLVIRGGQPICLSRSYVSQKGFGYWDFLSYN
ncbi:MAG: hypothetical protein JSS09_03730, partial [Verrucomicrobia bacterium]|nr:hypothetical protein [Verrucomicrobiota bacterium]